jgi:hypothetical protein
VNIPQPAVVDKVRKLLALASGNQNEHERDRAMEAAMELLAGHNLSLAKSRRQMPLAAFKQSVRSSISMSGRALWCQAHASFITRVITFSTTSITIRILDTEA